MKIIVDNAPHIFGPWFAEKMGIKWIAGQAQYIGLFDTDLNQPIASCMYEGFNGRSVRVHLATEGPNWLNREYLWFCFYYPFEQLKVTKLIALIESNNLKSVKWTKHCGYQLEATLKDAGQDADLLIYTMTKEQCKWLNLRNKNGQAHSTNST